MMLVCIRLKSMYIAIHIFHCHILIVDICVCVCACVFVCVCIACYAYTDLFMLSIIDIYQFIHLFSSNFLITLYVWKGRK